MVQQFWKDEDEDFMDWNRYSQFLLSLENIFSRSPKL